jgi:hypothetical protein
MFNADYIIEPSLQLRQDAASGLINPKFEFDEAIKNIRMSINELVINKKKEIGKAEVYIIAVVIDNTSLNPIQILKSDIYKNVRKGDTLPLGPNGFVIYRNEAGRIPNILDYKILVVESDEGVRDFGAVITKITNDKQFKEYVAAIVAISGVATPLAPIITAASVYTLNLIGRLMLLNNDDQLLLVQGSYDDKFDDLGVAYGEVKLFNTYTSIKYQVKSI